MKRLKKKADLEQTYMGFNQWATVKEIKDVVEELSEVSVEDLLKNEYMVEINDNHIKAIEGLSNGNDVLERFKDFNLALNHFYACYRTIDQQKQKLMKELEGALKELDKE